MYKYLNMSTVKAGKFYKNNNTEGICLLFKYFSRLKYLFIPRVIIAFAALVQ
jgi:hypothetical protein